MEQDSVVLSEYLPFYRFYIINVVDKNQAVGQLLDLQTIALICAAIVIGALVLVFLITNQITKVAAQAREANVQYYEKRSR